MTMNDIDMFLQEIQAKREQIFGEYCNTTTYYRLHDINAILNNEEKSLKDLCEKLDKVIGIVYVSKINSIDNPKFLTKAEKQLSTAQKILKAIENQIQNINWN